MRMLIALLMVLGLGNAAQAAELMGAAEARSAALAGEIVLVDIRTPEEWAKTGVADVAHPLNMRGQGFVARLKKLMDANAGKTLAVICATGGRSTFLTEALRQRGLSIVNVREGMLGSNDGPGWLKRSLPVRAPDAARTGWWRSTGITN